MGLQVYTNTQQKTDYKKAYEFNVCAVDKTTYIICVSAMVQLNVIKIVILKLYTYIITL